MPKGDVGWGFNQYYPPRVMVDDDDVERIAAAVLAKLAPLLQPQPVHGVGYRLSQQALEQRRNASQAARDRRLAPKKKRRSRIPVPNPAPEPTVETTTSENPVPKKTEKLSTGSSTAPATGAAFIAYAAAYKLRYGTFPVRNAKVNGMLAQYVKRVPAEEAPLIAAFYLSMEAPLYVRASHCIDLLLRDAEAVRMAWVTGRQTVTRVNGSHVTTEQRPWWEVWPALVEQGTELGIEQGDNPTVYRFEVLRAAYVAGRLPEDVATKLGVASDRPDTAAA